MKEEEKKKKTTKNVEKKETKKAAPKKEVKKETKKAAPKKEIKKTVKKETPKKVEKKVEKKTASKKETKKEVKKATPKKSVVKEATPKKEVKKVEKKPTTKKATTKKTTVVKSASMFVPTAELIANYEEHAEEIVKVNEKYEQEGQEAKANEINSNRLPRQVIIDERELISEVAEELHNEWVEEELKEFFERANTAKGNFSQGLENTLNAACYKKGKKRTDISFDRERLNENSGKLIESLNNYEEFRTLVGNSSDYVVNVKKYAKRNIPDNEKQADFKHSTGEENILRPFKELSTESKKTNINAAIDAFAAYKELTEAGVTLYDMKLNNDTRALVLKAMNANQMRNDPNYRVRFADIDESEKEKDLFAFDRLIDIVENNRSYTLYPIENATITDYDSAEDMIINGIEVETPVRGPMTSDEADLYIKSLENGMGEVEEKENIKVMGYVGVWMVAISTAALTAGIFALGAFLFK